MAEISEAQVLWGAALMVQRRYGPDASTEVARRISALAAAGDEVGCAVWRDIAARLDQLDADGRIH